MKFKKNLRSISEIKSFINSDSTKFLLETFKKRKGYLSLNIFSGISDAFFEFISMSMLYFIISILTSESKEIINLENFVFINNFSFLINFLNSLNFKTIFILSIIFTLLIQILQAFIRYINSLSTSYIEAAYLSLITKNIYSHIFKLRYIYSSKYKMGDLADYINSSPQTVSIYIFSINQLVTNIFISFVYIFFLIKLSFWNILILLLIFIISNKLRSILLPKVNFLASRALEFTLDLSKSVIEKFQALRLIYSNGLNEFVINEMDYKTDLLEDSLKKTSIKIHILPTLVSLSPIILLAFISIIYSFISDKNNLVSTMGILLISLQRINTRFVGIAGSLSRLAEFNPKLNRIISLFKEEDFKFRRLTGKSIRLPVKQITFSRVNFKYAERSKFSLKDINFTLKSGEITAVVGLSGAGKSSILDLLVGLFEPNSGDILIDNYNLKDINLSQWQRGISIVSQDSFLLNDSIINNIKFGLGKVSFKDIKNACIDSGSNKFIENLPNKYDTIIGERGFKLSGGERQRLSIARAFLKKSSVLILDEATSALDSKNEKFIKENIAKARYNKITLIVAHRLSTIKEADNIIVINHGMIVETGKHNDLIAQNQIYSKLWGIQSKI